MYALLYFFLFSSFDVNVFILYDLWRVSLKTLDKICIQYEWDVEIIGASLLDFTYDKS